MRTDQFLAAKADRAAMTIHETNIKVAGCPPVHRGARRNDVSDLDGGGANVLLAGLIANCNLCRAASLSRLGHISQPQKLANDLNASRISISKEQ